MGRQIKRIGPVVLVLLITIFSRFSRFCCRNAMKIFRQRRTALWWWCQSTSRCAHTLMWDETKTDPFSIRNQTRARSSICMSVCGALFSLYPRICAGSHRPSLFSLKNCCFFFRWFFLHNISFSYKLICCHYYYFLLATYVLAKNLRRKIESNERRSRKKTERIFAVWWRKRVSLAVKKNPMYFAVVYSVLTLPTRKIILLFG